MLSKRCGSTIFKNIISCQKILTNNSATAPIEGKRSYDALQEQALKEHCLLVDENDKVTGAASKADCHRVDVATGNVKLHRAFSVFLFNSQGEMLVQRRSRYKITFPDTYTNACCSHPLHDIEVERDEEKAHGIRRAAQRRLHYELGIPTDQIKPEEFQYLTRIHYADRGDGIWGEHEIDYILFLQKNVDLNPNENEISEVRYIARKNFDKEIEKFNAPLTPWFRLITQHRLKMWWDNLNQLEKFKDHKTIQRFDS